MSGLLGLAFDDITDPIVKAIGEGAYEIGGGDWKYGQDRVEADVKNLFRLPVPLPDLSDALAIFQEYLHWIPLDGLRQFRDLFPDVTDADFSDVPTAVTTIISNLTDNPLLITLLGLLIDAITGVIGGGITLLESFFGNFRDFVGIDFGDGGFDLEDARQLFFTNVIDPFMAVVDAVDQELRDALAGIGSGIEDIEDWVGKLLDGDSPLDAFNLFNVIPTNVMGQLPFSHLSAGEIPNLLANPLFHTDASVQGSGLWSWDSGAGNSTPGFVKTTAQGAVRNLLSNTVPVSENQIIDLSIFANWSGLTYTGTKPVKLEVLKLLNYEHVGVAEVAAPTSPPATQGWTKLGGLFTVPAGVDKIAMQLTVAANASAGTVRFDEGDIHKTGSNTPFVPWQNVFGVGGTTSLGESTKSTWDQLISGLVNQVGTDAGLGDLFNVGRDVSSWASLGRMGWDILGIRNNRSFNSGFNRTTESNIGLDKVALQTTAPTFGITQSSAILGYSVISQEEDRAVVSWQGYGTTNVTDCYINIYKMDTTTGVNTLVHASTNQIGLLTGGSVPVPVVYVIPTPIHVAPGDVFGIEIAVRGAGTHNIVGSPTWLQDQPTYPRRYSSVRNSGTSAAPSSFTPTYGSNVPFIEFGVSASTVPLPHSDVPTTITAVGASSTPIPDWVNFVDVVVVGAGGVGGAGSLYGVPGQDGGAAGAWATGTWARGTDFTGATTVSVNVGAGGTTLSNAFDDPSLRGGSTVVSIPGHTVTAIGGLERSSGNQKGQGAGNQVYRSVTYVGGGQQASEPGDGIVPGGGGSSGSNYDGSSIGGTGAKGRAWLVFRQS